MRKPKGKAPHLADKQERFLYEFASTGSMQKAEDTVGYSRGYGCRLMRRPGMQERLDEKLKQINEVEIVNVREILQETTYLAMSDATEILECRNMDDVKALPARVRKAIKSISVKQMIYEEADGSRRIETSLDLTMHDKIKPLALLAMHAEIGNKIGKNDKTVSPFTGLTLITRKKDG